MRIGIDFDNTIAAYGMLFRKIAIKEKFIRNNFEKEDKSEIKKIIINHYGENKWMKLQGLVYGKYMLRAELITGVTNFLYACNIRNYEIYIISHKTKYGHFDREKILLRNQALKWMKLKNFFDKNFINIKKENIFFCNSIKEKIDKITELNCNFFIDDLAKVLNYNKFPKNTKKIWLNRNKEKNNSDLILSLSTWNEIFDTIIGKIQIKDIKKWLKKLNIKNIKRIENINGQGNSQIYKITKNNQKKYILKYYPDKFIDRRPRLYSEYQALNFLHINKFKNIPKVKALNYDLNIGLYEWIKGRNIKKPRVEDLQSILDFIKSLKNISKNTDRKLFNNASEACLCAKDLIIQIESRILLLKKTKSNNKKIKYFLDDIHLLWIKIKRNYLKKLPKNSFDKPIKKNKQILSPSDISFNNVLKYKNKVTFIDFEYFGWDDPVKVAADFVWHPSMNLSNSLVNFWKEQMTFIFSDDINFSRRFESSILLYGIRWILIILNIFLPHVLIKKINANHNQLISVKNLQQIQLSKAIKIFNTVKKEFIK